MEQVKIDELIEKLFSKKYDYKSTTGDTWKKDIIDSNTRVIVENIIRGFFLENRDTEIGILKAKVFMYEQIISKSNFAPLIESLKIPSGEYPI